MDKIIIIKLDRQDVTDFCRCCESFVSDIDVIDGSNILDAKDFKHVILLSFNRNFCISINSNDEKEILRFNSVMEKYIA